MSGNADDDTIHQMTDASCPVVLDEPTQARLDHLYWMTDTPVREIARQLSLAGRSVSALATSWPAGFCCYRCRTEHRYTSRRGRSESCIGRRWPTPVTCIACRERRRPPSAAVLAGGLRTDRSVIAVTGRQRDQIDSCVEALARIGKGWDEHSLIMLHDGAEAIALGAALSAPTRHLGDSVVA